MTSLWDSSNSRFSDGALKKSRNYLRGALLLSHQILNPNAKILCTYRSTLTVIAVLTDSVVITNSVIF